MARSCFSTPCQALTPSFETKVWSSTKVDDPSITSLDGLVTAFQESQQKRWPKAFPEHTYSLGIYGIREGKRVYDIKYFEQQGLVSSYGKYHTGPAFLKQVSTLDEICDAFVEAKAAMAEAFDSDTTHKESYFSCLSFWSGPKAKKSAVVAKKADPKGPEPDPDTDNDVPVGPSIFGDDDDDW